MELTLNHMNVATNDLPTSKGFYEKYFGFEKRHEANGETFLGNKTGFLLALLPVEEPVSSPNGCTTDSPYSPVNRSSACTGK